jgi:predicted transcriptional regulator
MRRSKLESYEDILQVLVRKPLTIDSIAYYTNMDCIVLQQRLDFLMISELVEKRAHKKKMFYAITRRGATVLRTLNLTKRLEKLEATIRKIDEALQAIPALSECSEERKKKTWKNENY